MSSNLLGITTQVDLGNVFVAIATLFVVFWTVKSANKQHDRRISEEHQREIVREIASFISDIRSIREKQIPFDFRVSDVNPGNVNPEIVRIADRIRDRYEYLSLLLNPAIPIQEELRDQIHATYCTISTLDPLEQFREISNLHKTTREYIKFTQTNRVKN